MYRFFWYFLILGEILNLKCDTLFLEGDFIKNEKLSPKIMQV